MRHLDETQLVDALDGGSEAELHLRGCADCRARVEMLRTTLAAVRLDRVTEPSPLFWRHFTTGVNARIDAREPEAGTLSGGWLPAALAWSGVLALVLAVVSIIVAPKPPAEPPALQAGLAAAAPDVDIDEDEAWAVIRDLAGDLDYDAAHAAGVSPRPGAIDRAAMELTAAERAELARLIDAELKRIGP